MTIKEQWADLHTREKEARDNNRYGEATNLRKEILALKPLLQAYHASPQRGQKKPQSIVPRPKAIVPPAFNFYLHPASQKAQVLVDRVTDQWLQSGHIFRRPLKAEVLANYKKIIETVTLNVLSVLLRNIDAVRIRREEALFRTRSRYRPDVFDKKILTVLDDLHAMKVLKQVKGDRWVNGCFENSGSVDKGRDYNQTKLSVGSVIKELRTLLNVESVLEIGEDLERQEIIVLKKNETSALQEYEDTEATSKLREQMRRINLSLAKAGSLMASEVPPSIRAQYDERDRHLVRRFTYGSFTSGGRLWGGFWENMPRVQRPGILRINGEKTVECDFSGMLPRLAYRVIGTGAVPSGDVYAVPGFSPDSRDGLKKWIVASLMDTRKHPKDRFPRSVAAMLAPEDRIKGFKQSFELLTAHHPDLVKAFWIGLGHHLQFLESTILVNVLLELGQKRIAGLPLHDGVIVQESQSEIVKSIMENQAIRLLGEEFPVVVKGGRAES
jgi:hypothetical protein